MLAPIKKLLLSLLFCYLKSAPLLAMVQPDGCTMETTPTHKMRMEITYLLIILVIKSAVCAKRIVITNHGPARIRLLVLPIILPVTALFAMDTVATPFLSLANALLICLGIYQSPARHLSVPQTVVVMCPTCTRNQHATWILEIVTALLACL